MESFRYDETRLKNAIGSSFFIIGIFIFFIVALDLYVLPFPVSLGTFHFHAVGFPWFTEQVDDSSGIWRMPDYSQQFPNVYFLNYGQLLLISLMISSFGKSVMIFNRPSGQYYVPSLSRIGLAGTIISGVVLVYLWFRMTVLWCTYIIGDVVYYPATTPPPTAEWFQQFGLSPYTKVISYQGGLPFRVNTCTISISQGLHFDAILYLTAVMFCFSIILWKYYSLRENVM
jgi:hypothetical protein